ncbi:hypothetical protein HBB16_01550 [Pseudonocardia sp. MCCB 268]|nr:hypothetical protein [Pseudonocardia cytotoxica]
MGSTAGSSTPGFPPCLRHHLRDHAGPPLAMLPGRSIDSAYVQWGWRIPFFVGAALCSVWSPTHSGPSRRVPDLRRGHAGEAPIRDAPLGRNLRSLLRSSC